MNGDGALDLLVGSSTRASMSLHLGRGDGTFQPADARAVTPAYPTHQLAVGDVNGDAALDVVTCDGSSNPLLVHLGKGSGSFFPARSFAAGTNLFSIVLEDFNADGRLDVAVSNTAVPSQITVLLNTTAAP
ncbi:MAG: VCBS repeat-containing protein [Polyangia bacterium]